MEGEDHKPGALSATSIQVCEENELSINGSDEGVHEKGSKRKEILKEVKKQFWLAGPMIFAGLFLYFVQMVSVMFVGHLGKLYLSGAAMATSMATVVGFSLLLGLAGALETLSGQSYGAKEYHMIGIHMQRAMFVLLIVCIPLAVVLANTRPILILVGQDVDIAAEAGRYARFMIPSIFAFGLLQCLVKFLTTQNIVFPIVVSFGISTLLHVLWCWVLVFKSGLGSRGAALANSISYWINVLLLALYVKFSSSCSKTWTGFSRQAFRNILTFLRLAIPSAVMVCMEMWSYEIMVFLCGRLPNPELETSMLSIILNTASTVWMIPCGLGSAVSTRVSNELGAGHPKAARLAVRVAVTMAITQGVLVGLVIILIRNIWGYAYSNDIEVVKYVAIVMPILAGANFLDGLQTVLSGNARGCGWQKIGAYVNLGSYYLVGIPLAVVLGFVLHMGGKAEKAGERVRDSIVPADAVS
ncbi:MATE efflux family protein 6 [Morus notabilis]|uniref:Protein DETOXIFICATION n=1 Tax=Morus notabilis TaxID=981085 RepID=W9QNZ8_9ROSA|nr:MATE efflux family protein 6 [Morus notabilis]